MVQVKDFKGIFYCMVLIMGFVSSIFLSGCMLSHFWNRNESSHQSGSASRIEMSELVQNDVAISSTTHAPQTATMDVTIGDHKHSKKSKTWMILGGIGMGLMMGLMFLL